jgi:ankyrin repeat protein
MPHRTFIFICVIISMKLLAYLPQQALGQDKDSLGQILITAAWQGDEHKVLELIGAGANVNAVNIYGISPLMYATEKNHIDIVKILLFNGADPDLMPYDGYPALIMAINSRNPEMSAALLNGRAAVNIRDEAGFGPMHHAAYNNDLDHLELMMEFGGNPNDHNFSGTTPLQIASYYGNYEVAAMLLDKGADANLADSLGFKPLMLAAQNDHIETADLLMHSGADPNTSNKEGLNALGAAIIGSNYGMAAFLLDSAVFKPGMACCGYNAAQLSMLMSNRSFANTLSRRGYKPGGRLLFNEINFGYLFNFNADDMFQGGRIGLKDARYNMEAEIGVSARYARTRIHREVNNNYYQFRESRVNYYAGISKIIYLGTTGNMAWDLLAGVRAGYSGGNYRGTMIEARKFGYISPVIQADMRWRFLSFRAGYSFMNIKTDNVGNHRAELSVNICSPLIKLNKHLKTYKWQ